VISVLPAPLRVAQKPFLAWRSGDGSEGFELRVPGADGGPERRLDFFLARADRHDAAAINAALAGRPARRGAGGSKEGSGGGTAAVPCCDHGIGCARAGTGRSIEGVG
jgi:hypothetical protein